MLLMEFGPCREFDLILGFDSLLAIPPGAAAIEIISNVRGADNRHINGLRKLSIAQIF
jgi:hypothetical protein